MRTLNLETLFNKFPWKHWVHVLDIYIKHFVVSRQYKVRYFPVHAQVAWYAWHMQQGHVSEVYSAHTMPTSNGRWENKIYSTCTAHSLYNTYAATTVSFEHNSAWFVLPVRAGIHSKRSFSDIIIIHFYYKLKI